MAENKNIQTLEDIRNERLKIKERRKELERNFFSFTKNENLPGAGIWMEYAKNFVFNRFLNKKSKSTHSSTSQKNEKKNIFSFFSQLLTHPTATSFLSITKRSFIKWQLFNVGVYLLQVGYKTWQKKRKEKKVKDAIIQED